MTILATIVVLGVLIFVHELGHFWAARSVGIRVERFSIGLGPRVYGFHRGDTEYVISAIPLGGYVKMAGMDDEVMEAIEGGKGSDGGATDGDAEEGGEGVGEALHLATHRGAPVALAGVAVVGQGAELGAGRRVDFGGARGEGEGARGHERTRTRVVPGMVRSSSSTSSDQSRATSVMT